MVSKIAHVSLTFVNFEADLVSFLFKGNITYLCLSHCVSLLSSTVEGPPLPGLLTALH